MSEVSVTPKNMQEAFPEFANYPTAYLQRFITMATMYIKTTNYRISPDVRTLAIELMTAHLMTISAQNEDGTANSDFNTNGSIVTSASIEGVSISTLPPIASDAFSQWIQSTGYGRQYWALMSANNPVGIFWVGNPRAFGIR